ncbi:MAG TPA: ABC transporter substrate-binding protein [Trebonia sp.]|jgi:NitT/TauT family transport system substrate-binding protein|nr:ABC transporter substrate-binding protein [Trebonia sp.]
MASAPAIHIGKRIYPLFIAALLVALAACSGSGSTGSATAMSAVIPGPSGPLESPTISVEAVPTADEAGLYVAYDLGYFKKEGLNVKISITGGGETALPDLTDGKANIIAGNYVSFVQAQIQGKYNLKIIADGSQMQPGNQALYVMPNSKFSTVADLVKYHATIGVNTLDNIGTLLVGSLLTENGYPNALYSATNPAGPVKLVVPTVPAPTPFVGAMTMLENHQLDAAWLPEPYGTLAQEAGAVKLADFDQGSLQNFPIGAYIGTQSWIEKNPNTVAAFLHALQEGQEVADTNRAQVESSLVKNTLLTTGFNKATAQQIAALLTLDTYPLTMDVPTMQRVADSMFQFNVDGKTISKAYDILNMIQQEPGMVR